MSEIETITLIDHADASQQLTAAISFDGVVDLRFKNKQGETIGSVYVELHDDQVRVHVWGEDENRVLADVTVVDSVKMVNERSN